MFPVLYFFQTFFFSPKTVHSKKINYSVYTHSNTEHTPSIRVCPQPTHFEHGLSILINYCSSKGSNIHLEQGVCPPSETYADSVYTARIHS